MDENKDVDHRFKSNKRISCHEQSIKRPHRKPGTKVPTDRLPQNFKKRKEEKERNVNRQRDIKS